MCEMVNCPACEQLIPDGEECPVCEGLGLGEDAEYEESAEYDGQPTEYEEWQDLYGGDDSEYGTFGDYPGSEW